MLKKIYFLILLSTIQHLSGTPLVYNMKVRRAFSIGTIIKTEHVKPFYWLLTALPIWYTRTRTITTPTIPQPVHEHTHAAGSLFNIRLLAPEHWWAEITTGLEKQAARYEYPKGFHTARTGFDDVIATVGKNWFFKQDNGQISLYGLGGIPTHWDVSTCDTFDPMVGSRFYGAGAGGEISYSFIRTIPKSLIGLVQARFVHFFNRNWFPIIPCAGHIQPGNITDIVLLLQYRRFKNVIELGYNPTFFTHQAVALPTQKISSDTFVRNALFINYLHLIVDIPGLHVPGALGVGCNISRSRKFDTKIFGAWLNLSVLL